MALNKEDIAELTMDELQEKLKSEKVRYSKLKFNHTVSPLDNPLLLRVVRRDISRLKTEIKQREMSEQANVSSKSE